MVISKKTMIQSKILFLHYPACSTCQKAKRWLSEQGVGVEVRHIVDEALSVEELTRWIALSGLPIRKFFNTSGVLYRELGLSDKLSTMSESDQIALLASNGKLIKRPLLASTSFVLVGFKPEAWENALQR